jgi:glutathione reductase (NADPH)
MPVNAAESSYDYDLFCIGAGSGGTRAARMAAANYGAKVAICEMPYDPIASDEKGGAGGTCVLRGCVPKKLFVYCSEYSEAFKDAQGFGWEIEGKPSLNWRTFMEKKNNELKRLNGVYMRLLEGAGVEVHEGRGTIVDGHTVSVNGKTFTAKNILIATGGKAFVPDIEGHELAIISDNALEIQDVPESVAVIGGGYIGVEFAGIFANLGSQTHLVYRQDLPLRGFDEEVRNFAAEQYALNGINIHNARNPKSIAKLANGKLALTLGCAQSSQPDEVIEVDHVMMATGRKPNVGNLGLENAGIQLNERGAIKVDQFSRTTCDSVWAVGDVTGRMELTPVALMESMALLKTLFEDTPTAPDHSNIATAVFSHPEIGTVGVTEEKAVSDFKNVDVYTSSFRPMRNTISGSEGRTFMKLIVASDSQKVVGVHMVGPDSAEIMQGMGVAVKMGVTKPQLDSVVGIHPSSAEEFVTMRSPTRTIRNGKVV